MEESNKYNHQIEINDLIGEIFRTAASCTESGCQHFNVNKN